MARKDSQRTAQTRAWSDIIGIVLIACALLLLVAQLSFERTDLEDNRLPPHNWIGKAGAHVAWWLFFLFGGGAYVLPLLMVVFGLGYLFVSLSFLRRRSPWGIVLFGCFIGTLDLYMNKAVHDKMAIQPNLPTAGFLEKMAFNLNAPSAGGVLGDGLNKLIFGHFGKPGASIIFITLYFISLLFLTNFQLAEWLRAAWATVRNRPKEDESGWTAEEKALARKARELEHQAEKLKQQVEKQSPRPAEGNDSREARPVLGADLQPVPAPSVRDLSIPAARGGKPAKPKGSEQPVVEPDMVGEVIPAKEVVAATAVGPATTSEVLGKETPDKSLSGGALGTGTSGSQSRPAAEPIVASADGPDGTPVADSVTINDNSGGRIKKAARKKPITVASAPAIGNYQLPPMDFLHLPDQTVRPTESKEELMANARLMQSTLAQFDIEVALGDITKGPTITRYELHPAPGVRLEKITALSNNIAAALKAERIHILAPVPGKSSVGVEVPNAVKTKVIMRDLLESEEWAKT
ncbi:MAG TPA: DNA translocase FtsK 4TM domain-containing protein, partial [Verrucomicrobiae bacterium]|nr:DNA translocase FtsK 4TM domain-containing protein [Verrucomicrobiae bacterium]